jgi:energy-coupling factor transport system ATP-binding protein
VGLSGTEEAHPAELSASRQRLLALATVLAREPAVLALDEPTVGLDRHGLESLQRAVERAAARGAAVVMVTHDLDYARSTAHRVLELSGGSLREI